MKNKKIIIFGIIALFVVGIILFYSLNSQNEENDYDETSHSDFLAEHPKGAQFTTDITGEEMKELDLEEIAFIWEVDSIVLLERINADLDKKYTLQTLVKEIPEFNSKPVKLKLLIEGLY
jgi:hypothetical protein